MDVEIVVNEKLRRTLTTLANLDKTPEMAAAKRRIGEMALQDQRRHFSQAAANPQAAGWEELSDTTVALRKGGPKIYDEADIEAKREQLQALRDTNRTFASLTPGGSGNVLNVLPGAVQIGTAVSYAKTQQEGGQVVFRFGEEEEKRFAKNVSDVKRGKRRPKAGTRHVWKRAGKESPWNEMFFRWRAALRKLAGRVLSVPARPFLRPPTLEELGKYTRVVAGMVKKLAGG